MHCANNNLQICNTLNFLNTNFKVLGDISEPKNGINQITSFAELVSVLTFWTAMLTQLWNVGQIIKWLSFGKEPKIKWTKTSNKSTLKTATKTPSSSQQD